MKLILSTGCLAVGCTHTGHICGRPATYLSLDPCPYRRASRGHSPCGCPDKDGARRGDVVLVGLDGTNEEEAFAAWGDGRMTLEQYRNGMVWPTRFALGVVAATKRGKVTAYLDMAGNRRSMSEATRYCYAQADVLRPRVSVAGLAAVVGRARSWEGARMALLACIRGSRRRCDHTHEAGRPINYTGRGWVMSAVR